MILGTNSIAFRQPVAACLYATAVSDGKESGSRCPFGVPHPNKSVSFETGKVDQFLTNYTKVICKLVDVFSIGVVAPAMRRLIAYVLKFR